MGARRGVKVKKVVIVGGGITGLAAAYRLQTLAPEINVTLIERDTRLGGKISTERVDGFVIENAPDSFLSRKPQAIALCQELGITNRLQGRNSAHTNTYVMRNGTLYDLPAGLTGLVPTNLDALASSPLISTEGKRRLAKELTLPPAPPNKGDESLADFASRRLGKEVFEQLIEPLMGGIYSGDTKQLSLAATFPQLRQLELKYGSLIKGLLAKQETSSQSQTEPAYPPFLSFRTGMQELIEVLVQRLTQSTLLTGHAVESLVPDKTKTGYALTLTNGRRIQADAVILTTPAYITAKLVAPWDKALADAHRAIPYASTAVVTVAYEESKLPIRLDGRGYVIPAVEKTEVKACTWTSCKWTGRAPEGFALLRLFLGRYGKRNILQESDEQLVMLARQELKRTLNITAAPHFTRVHRWPQAMPQYNLGHVERLAQINSQLAQHKGLLLAGASYRGVGIPDCIRSADQAAKNAVEYFIKKE